MCEQCNRITAQRMFGSQQGLFGGVLCGALGGGGFQHQAAQQPIQQPLMAQAVEHNRNFKHVSKSKMAEIAANMEKTYMMIPSCGVRDKLEEDAEYLKRMAK